MHRRPDRREGQPCLRPIARTRYFVEPPAREVNQGDDNRVLSRRDRGAREDPARVRGHGLIYTVSRGPGNYRLFDGDALWCVEVVGNLRAMGLTLAEIREPAGTYLQRRDESVGPWPSARANVAPHSPKRRASNFKGSFRKSVENRRAPDPEAACEHRPDVRLIVSPEFADPL